MNEIDVDKADFQDIKKFAMNLLGVEPKPGYGTDEKVAYFSTMTQVMLGRKIAESTTHLASEINAASRAADIAARKALRQATRMVWATWALVVVTGFLGIATAGLVYYTSELVSAAPTVINVPGR